MVMLGFHIKVLCASHDVLHWIPAFAGMTSKTHYEQHILWYGATSEGDDLVAFHDQQNITRSGSPLVIGSLVRHDVARSHPWRL